MRGIREGITPTGRARVGEPKDEKVGVTAYEGGWVKAAYRGGFNASTFSTEGVIARDRD